MRRAHPFAAVAVPFYSGIVLACAAACGDSGSDSETPCTPLGGPGVEPTVVALVENDTNGGFVELQSGGEVHLWQPLQGGHVIYVGARVTGLCADSVMITGRILDAETGEVIAHETRRGFGLEPQGDGTGLSAPFDLGAVANVALCPPPVEALDVAGTPFLLEVEVSDADGRRAMAGATVTPVCGQADAAARAACECECSAAGADAACP
jgi:hypothetical protein